MNDLQKQVREYCENHKGIIIDVSKVKDEEFFETPYKTLLKILNRLEEEKLIAVILSDDIIKKINCL